MDGATAALTVVAFSGQLVSTIRRARKFLKDVQNAPEEAVNLRDTLEEFEDFLEAAKSSLEAYDTPEDPSAAARCIISVLKRCERNIGKICDATHTIDGQFETQSRRRKVWASVKTVAKKDVEVLQNQIQETKHSLLEALSLDSNLQLHQLRSLHFQRMSLANQQMTLSTATILPAQPEPKHLNTRSWDIIVRTKATSSCLYWGVLGKVELHHQAKFMGACGSTTENAIAEEKRLSYRPPLLRTGLEVCYGTGLFQIPRSLSFFQILPRDSMWDLYSSGNTESFTKALSKGDFSPFARDENGKTFLHLAAFRGNFELCSLLLQMGADPSHTNDHGNKPLHCACQAIVGSRLDTMRALATERADFTAEDLPSLLDDSYHAAPEGVELLVSTYSYVEQYSHDDIYDGSFLRHVMYRYGKGEVEWAEWIRKWLHSKPDVHAEETFMSQNRSQYLRQDQNVTSTLLDDLFKGCKESFPGELCARGWLSMLQEADYDVKSYLEKEKELRLSQDLLLLPKYRHPCNHPGRQLVFEIGEDPKVSWDWWFDPSCEASLVLREFRYMGPCHDDEYLDYDRYSWIWESSWPFCYPHWSENCKPYGLRSPDMKTWQKLANKAARRYNRKFKKNHPELFADITDGLVIPGAYIVDEF